MITGNIVRLVFDRRFGFVRDSAGRDFFFHGSGVLGPMPFEMLREGQEVTFEEEASPKGLRAHRVTATATPLGRP